MPALTFGSPSTSRAVTTSFFADFNGAFFCLFYCTSTNTRQRLMLGPNDTAIEINLTASNTIDCYRSRTTTYAACSATPTNFQYWGTNKWLVIAWIWNTVTGAVNSDQKILLGPPQGPWLEPSSYTTQTAGSGTVDNTSTTNLYIGNNGAFNIPFVGSVAAAGACFNGAGDGTQIVTPEQVKRQLRNWNKPAVYGTLALWRLGDPKFLDTCRTLTQADDANFDLTATGATWSRAPELDYLFNSRMSTLYGFGGGLRDLPVHMNDLYDVRVSVDVVE